MTAVEQFAAARRSGEDGVDPYQEDELEVIKTEIVKANEANPPAHNRCFQSGSWKN
jgi:hypothetical protein